MNSEIKWADFNGFLRDEKKSYNFEDYYIGKWWLLLVPIINFFCVLRFAIRLITAPFYLLYKSKVRQRIQENAYDIEETIEPYKIIRNINGKMGLCYWENYLTNFLILPSEYHNIQESGVIHCYILQKGSKYGLYNVEEKEYVIEVIYDSLVYIGGGVYQMTREGLTTKRNFKGDRIIE